MSICQNLFSSNPQWALFNFARNYRRISLCVRAAIRKLSIYEIDFNILCEIEQRRSFQCAVWHLWHSGKSPRWTWKGLFSIANPLDRNRFFMLSYAREFVAIRLHEFQLYCDFCMLKMFSQNEWSHFIEISLKCARPARAEKKLETKRKSFSTNFF